ncbi:ras GEF [Lichtheimia hyalospora FSU 10163]|nr:ras GEF [Lichtheimia hyalospora FSU 10163]
MPAVESQLKRRSKSLDDLALKCTIADTKAWLQSDPDRLCHYNDTSTPTSPVVTFVSPNEDLPKRRHSSCCEPISSKECLRLATIYGWVTTNTLSCPYDMAKYSSRDVVQMMPDPPKLLHQKRRQPPMLYSSRSFTQDYLGSNKLSKMFMRKRTLDKRKQRSTPSIQLSTSKQLDDINTMDIFGNNQITIDTAKANADINNDSVPLPTPPIENDPHVFDVLSRDVSCFITYNNRDDDTTVMTSATVEKLVEKLTSEMDSEFMMDFFLTYRQFLSSIKLCKLLILRFRWALLENTDARSLVRIRTFVVIRHWLTHYWDHDFSKSRTLRFILSTFLSELRSHPTILGSPRDARIIKNLRNLFKRQRKQKQEKMSEDLQSCGGISLSTTPGLFDTRRSSNSGMIEEHRHKDSGFGNIQATKANHGRPNSTSSSSSTTISSPWASRFCMIERQMLQYVTWDELVELRWKDRRSGTASRSPIVDDVTKEQSGVEQLIGYFNRTCQWVTSEIVQSQSLELRVRVIEKYIRIALKCYMHRNYSTLMQILLGLQSPAISRLEKTWQRVNTYEMQVLDDLKELTKPFRNWKNIRAAMSKAIEDIAEASAVESILTHAHDDDAIHATDARGSIPFLGLYLSDLVFNAELPSILTSSSSNQQHDNDTTPPIQSDADNELRTRLCTHLVNYNKFRITASVVRHVLAFQVLSRAYDFDYHPDIFSKLQQLQFLDNAEIRKASLLCEE